MSPEKVTVHTFGVKEIERQPWPKNRGAAPDSLTSIGRLYGRKDLQSGALEKAIPGQGAAAEMVTVIGQNY